MTADHLLVIRERNCETDWAQQLPSHAVSAWRGHDITLSAWRFLQVPKGLYDKLASQ